MSEQSIEHTLAEKKQEQSAQEPTAEQAGEKGTQAVPAKAAAAPSLIQIEMALQQEMDKQRYRKTLRNTIYILLIVASVAVIIAVLIFPVLRIKGNSMTDTLQNGDIVVAMNGSQYQTDEVIAFYYNNNVLVKRVIASEGQWVDIDKDGTVYVDGVQTHEPYLTDKALGECDIDLPYQVPDGKVFVMGDHRATSVDSRSTKIGCISEELIIGKILVRVWPFSGIGLVK